MMLSLGLALVLNPIARPVPLVIVSWDGGADWVMDRLIKEGKLPNVAKMAREGMSAERTIPAFPSKTAVSHFALYSGTWHNKSGVSGNSSPLLPRSAHTLLEQQNGFDASQHQTEPLWVTFAKGGLNVDALSAAGSYPPGPDLERLAAANIPREHYKEFSGFESGFAGARVYRKPENGLLKFQVGADTFAAKPYDDPQDPVVGFDSVEITKVAPFSWDRHPAIFQGPILLKPLEADGKRLAFSQPISVYPQGAISDGRGDAPRGMTAFRLFSLDSKTGEMCLYHRDANYFRGTESTKDNNDYSEAYGGFHDSPFEVYLRGDLGKTLVDCGDGIAEKRVVECVREDMECLKRSFRNAIKNHHPDVVFHYSPQSDSAGHCWMGVLDPSLPGYDKKLAGKLMPYYEAVFEAQDDWLGDMMKAAGPHAAFALVSDHGMSATRNFFFINRVLEQAGLCVYGADGQIDLSKTKACSPPWGDFMVVANTTDRKDGIVPLDQKDEVLRVAAEALKKAVDPRTGKVVVTKIIWPKDATELGLGGPGGGDFYLDFVPGIYPRASKSDVVVGPTQPILGSGSHGFWPERRTMNSIFYLWGDGVPHKKIGKVYAVDVAPTLCRLMGVPVSTDNQGRARN